MQTTKGRSNRRYIAPEGDVGGEVLALLVENVGLKDFVGLALGASSPKDTINTGFCLARERVTKTPRMSVVLPTAN